MNRFSFRKLGGPALGLVLTLVAAQGVAGANTQSISDPKGDNVGGQDIKLATVGHTDAGKLKHKIVTYNKINKDRPPYVEIKDVNGISDCKGTWLIGNFLHPMRIWQPCAQYLGDDLSRAFPDSHTVVYKFAPKSIRPTVPCQSGTDGCPYGLKYGNQKTRNYTWRAVAQTQESGGGEGLYDDQTGYKTHTL